MKDVVLSFELFDLIFVAELSLHKQGLALFLLVRNQPSLFLELSQHFFIILSLPRQLFSMPFTHIFHDLFQLLDFEDSFVSLKESSF